MRRHCRCWSPPRISGKAFSSALAGSVGGPRMLMAMGEHGVVPGSAWLSELAPDGEPRNAVLVTGALTLAALMMRDLNSIAALLTMFFLITYSVINIVLLVETALGLVSFRPTMRVHWLVPLLGAIVVALLPKRRPELVFPVSIGVSILPLAASVWILVNFVSGDPLFQFTEDYVLSETFGFGWRLGVDGIDAAARLVDASLLTRRRAASGSRYSMLETMRQDYITPARSKGLAERGVIYRHAFRNALIPVVTIGGLLAGAALGFLIVPQGARLDSFWTRPRRCCRLARTFSISNGCSAADSDSVCFTSSSSGISAPELTPPAGRCRPSAVAGRGTPPGPGGPSRP